MKQTQTTPEVAMYCPVCAKGKVFLAASQEEADRVRLLGPQEADSASYFTKCRACKSQIGVAFQREEPETIRIPFLGTITA